MNKMDQKRKRQKAHLLYIIAQTIYGICTLGGLILYNFITIRFREAIVGYAVFVIVALFLSSAFVKYTHTLHGLIEDSDFFWSHYADIFILQINGANLELSIIGFPFILMVLGISRTISFSLFCVLCALLVGVIYISGKLAENTVKHLIANK